MGAYNSIVAAKPNGISTESGKVVRQVEESMRKGIRKSASGSVALVLACIAASASGQEFVGPGEWLDRLDREHRQLVSPEGHARAKGHVEAVDNGPGIITLISDEVQSPDKTVRMPEMRMVFHVTNRQLLEGIRPGDIVEFEAARLRGAVMIVSVRRLN
jgi:Cu/Ag efflux protein CusF